MDGIGLTSLLFGNISETGELENDYLDEDCKKQLSYLGVKEEFNSFWKELIGPDLSSKDEGSSPSDDAEKDSTEEEGANVDQKLPTSVDFFDTDEVIEDVEAAKDADSKDSGVVTKNENDVQPCVSLPTLTIAESSSERALEKPDTSVETPLAAILPQKYANVDVKELFPDFRPNSVLRFSRLFGSGKANSSCYRWKMFKKKRKRARSDELQRNFRLGCMFDVGYYRKPDPSQVCVDDEEVWKKPATEQEVEKTVETVENNDDGPKVADWRFGPAQLWYDMLNVPETGDGFDYGFRTISTDKIGNKTREESVVAAESDTASTDVYSHDSYLMISQINWEDDIIWNAEEIKHKVLQTAKTRSNVAGWIPTSSNRIAQTFSQPGKGVNPVLGGSSSSLRGGNSATSWSTSVGGKSGKMSKHQQQMNNQDDNGDDTWYSIFPVENEELIYGVWEEEVIWDAQSMNQVPKPKLLTLDPNDENIILGIPNDIDPTKQRLDSNTPTKVKIPHPHVKKSKLLLGKAGVINVMEEDAPPSPSKSPDHDPFNISNDRYYSSRSADTSLKVGAGNLIQHSTPVIELKSPFVQTHMGPMRLRNFHRPAIKRFSHGVLAVPNNQPVYPLTKHIRKKAKLREQERIASGGGDIFFMRNPEDLTGRDGDLILVEFCEEHPPLINLVGMCSKIKNYYKRKAGKDQGPLNYKYGETAYAHSAPFLGTLAPGKSMQAIENTMYRAPVFEHQIQETDFLVIRTRNQYFIREFNGLFVAGQLCPLYEVPSPNSKRANNFVRDFLQVFIYRLFWKSKGVPKRICMDEVRKAFPTHSESSVRKRLKMCADFRRTGNDSNLWVIKSDFRLPPEEEIRAMVTPEQCCGYFSMAAAEQRLKDAGYGEKFLFAPQDDDDDDLQLKMDDEIKVAPWNTTRAYIQAMKGKCLLQLTGPADPTGCGEGFSYVRVPNKPVTRQSKEEQKSQPKRVVTGTDADLRRLSLNNAKAILRKSGVPEEEIKKLSRWEVIDVVRTLSTEKAKAGEEGMTKFSRGNRFSIAEHQERYKEECQRIFDLQNRVLTSNEILSTDEDESTDEENGSDIEEMGKNIENMLSNKKTSMQLSLEKEEQERQELRKMIMGGGLYDGKKSKGKKKGDEDSFQSSSGSCSNHPGRVLKIYRTFRDPEGKEYTRLEVVRKPAVIDAYVKIRTTKDEDFIKNFAVLDEAQKEEMKREKRRIQEQLRRIKRNQEREKTDGYKFNFGLSPTNRKLPLQGEFRPMASRVIKHKDPPAVKVETPRKPRPYKSKPDLKVKCGACGATGHMRTNKACPQYHLHPSAPVNVALTQEQEEEFGKQLMDEVEDLVNVDGTKVKLSSKLIKHAEEMKRKSLLLKVPKDVLRRKRSTPEDLEYDYLKKLKKDSNRRCTDPVVALSSILEGILNEMRSLPDVQPFLFPVNAKAVPDYYKIVQRPMDLQTMRESLRQKGYQTREEFLTDVNQIVENSTVYNGAKSILTLAAKNMLQVCVDRLAEKEDKLMKLEKAINPLLDDNDQVALSFILGNILSSMKTMAEAWPFAKPVNKRVVKDYYDIVKQPMHLEMIQNNITGHKYHSRHEFLADIELIVNNCIVYNGKDSSFTQKAEALYKIAQSSVNEFDEHLTTLEEKLKLVQNRALERTDEEEEEELEELSLSDDGQPQEQEDQDVQEENIIEEQPDTVMEDVVIDDSIMDITDDADSKDGIIKSETQQLLEDDLHCSSEDDEDMDMMEVKGMEGIETEIIGNPDDESQAAEAMMQLGNFTTNVDDDGLWF